MCTKKHNHMMYDSWDTEWDWQSFLSFWVIFCPFNPPLHLMIPKIKILKLNEKNTWRYYHFANVYRKWQSYIWCMVPEIWNVMKRILKNWKKHLEISSFKQVYQKSWSYATLFLRQGHIRGYLGIAVFIVRVTKHEMEGIATIRSSDNTRRHNKI